MTRIAFTVQLNKGAEKEYSKRHNDIWPELKEVLHSAGISDYSIFLEEKSNTLFGVLKVESPEAMDQLPQHPIMKKWWSYMKDLMATNPDNSPVSIPLKEVFYLP